MSQSLTRLIGFLVLILVFIVGFFVVQFFFTDPRSRSREQTSPLPELIVQTTRAGDFEGSVSNNLSIQTDPNKSVEEKALAIYNALGAQYRLTGDMGAALQDIQNMKKIILDPKVTLRTRVDTLNVLAGQYSISGRDQSVFTEIFKDAPFSAYLAPEDPDLSARNLFEWSYNLMPTSFAAISIARWYTEQAVLNPEQDANTTRAYAQQAEDYLKKADAASVEEAKQDSSYSNSTRYLVYRYWRAMVIGRLAGQIGEPYRSQYRAAFEEFISFAQAQQNVLAKEYVLYARFFYASRLARGGDEATAKIQLDSLAQEMGAVQNPDTNAFVRFLRSERTSRPNGANWTVAKNMSKLSPTFKAVVEQMVGPTS